MNTAEAYIKGAGTEEAVAKALDLTKEEATHAVKTMKKINGLFASTCPIVHGVCHGGLKIVGMDKKFGDMFRRGKDDLTCQKESETLEKLMEDCQLKAMELVREYFANLQEIATAEKMDETFHENYTGGVF